LEESQMTNQELMEKAAIVTGNMANAGLLNAEQSNKFIDYVIDETTMKNMVRVVRFRNSQRLIEKINVANRVAVPKAEATDPRVRRGVSTSKVTLEHHELMVPFEISDDVKDENIEGDSVEDHIIKMMATRLANNIEELYWDGNTLGPAALESDMVEGGSGTLYVRDNYLGLFQGWLKAAEAGHVLDALNGNVTKTLLSRALKEMPTKFRKNKAAMKFMMSPNHEQDYLDHVATRATMAGDAALADRGMVPSYGVGIVPVSLLQPEPGYVEDSVANTDGVTPTQLSFAPISDLVLTTQTLGDAPEAAYIEGTDYTVDAANGTWTRLGPGAIGAGATVKATYNTAGRILLTMPQNMIVAIGREVRIERARNIFKTVNEFAITVKVFCTFEETDAVVLVKNVANP
jgi:hypothetical protein